MQGLGQIGVSAKRAGAVERAAEQHQQEMELEAKVPMQPREPQGKKIFMRRPVIPLGGGAKRV